MLQNQQQRDFKKRISSTVTGLIKTRKIQYDHVQMKTNGHAALALGHLFHCEGEDAKQLIEQMNTLARKTGLSPKTCCIYLLSERGVFKS